MRSAFRAVHSKMSKGARVAAMRASEALSAITYKVTLTQYSFFAMSCCSDHRAEVQHLLSLVNWLLRGQGEMETAAAAQAAFDADVAAQLLDDPLRDRQS